jgi:hypothetical protein
MSAVIVEDLGPSQHNDPAGADGRSDPASMPLERVEAEICTLAGQIAAATARFLTLLADFDEREGWAGWGVHSCAHWLSWRCGLDLRTAREHVRVARALRELPKIADAFGQGRISYAKTRAVSRVATCDTEDDLLHAALHNPAAHVERLVRGLRKAQRNLDDEEARRRGTAGSARNPVPPRVQWRWNDDGTLRIWGHLSAEDGARLLAGLTRMEEQRRRADHGPTSRSEAEACGQKCSAEHRTDNTQNNETEPTSHKSSNPSTCGVAPADLGPALLAGAELMCTAVDTPIHAPAADVVVHVDADTLTQTAQHEARGATDGVREGRLDDGPPLLHTVLQMLACDGRIQLSVRAADGRTLDLGRKRRRPARAQLDALWRRDRGCTHPGCGRTRFLHAHHVRPWAAGGPTDLDNLVLLCGEHHRSLHDGAFAIVALGRQRFRFHGPRGAERPQAPKSRGNLTDLTAKYTHISPSTIEPDWDGTPLDLPHATDVFLHNWAIRAQSTDCR